MNYEELRKWDLVEKIQPLLDSGFRFRCSDGKATTDFGFNWRGPWISVKRCPHRKCALWNRILFNYFDVIPSFCLECWKVVARPTTLEELFALLDFQIKLDRPSKCGLELRPYVQRLRNVTHSGKYGGYWYNDSLEQGRDCYETVRRGLPEHIPVILKRYCTEFEHKHGPSDRFQQSNDDRKWEELVDFWFDIPILDDKQPEVIRNHVKRIWIEYADEHNDETALLYTGGKHIYKTVECVTYHKKEKHDGLPCT